MVKIIGLAVFEPAESQLVDLGAAGNKLPLRAPIAGAHRGVAVGPYALAVVEHGLRLKTVGRNPSQVIEAGAQVVALCGKPVELAKAQLGGSGALQHLKVPVEEAPCGVALRRR